MPLERFSGTTALAQAQSWANLPADELKRRAAVAANARDVEALWNLTKAYLFLHGAKGSKVSPGTLRQYRGGLSTLVDAWQGENLLRPIRDAGTIYIRTLELGLAPSTVEVRLAAARTLYRALRWSGATEGTPFENVKVSPDPTPDWEKRGAYSTADIEHILRNADDAETVMVLLGAHAGLRIAEMASMEWRDVHSGQLRVTGKGGKVARVNLSERLEHAIERLRIQAPISHRRRGSEMVLPWSANRLRERFKDLCEKSAVGYDEKAVHGLRHSAGTRLYQQTKDINRAARHLRHSNVNTTKRYAKLSDDEMRSDLHDW